MIHNQEIDIYTKLISVYKVRNNTNPDQDLNQEQSYLKLSISYEIVIINKTDYKINNLSIKDTFFGLLNNPLINTNINMRSCNDNLVVIIGEYVSDCPELLDSNKSYLLPHSSGRIIVNVILSAVTGNYGNFTPVTPPPIIYELMNYIIVNGYLEKKSECNNYLPVAKMNTITSKTELWIEKDGVILTNPFEIRIY